MLSYKYQTKLGRKFNKEKITMLLNKGNQFLRTKEFYLFKKSQLNMYVLSHKYINLMQKMILLNSLQLQMIFIKIFRQRQKNKQKNSFLT